MRFIYFLILLVFINFKSYSATDCQSFTKEFIDESKNNKNVESFKNYLSKAVDTKFITKFSLGTSWRTFSVEQKKIFFDVYSKYIISKYATNFTKFPLKSYKIMDIKNDERRPEICNVLINIDTVVNGQEKSYPLTATITTKNGFFIQDIIFENVSLLQTHKQEISSLLQSKGFDGTIQLLKESIR